MLKQPIQLQKPRFEKEIALLLPIVLCLSLVTCISLETIRKISNGLQQQNGLTPKEFDIIAGKNARGDTLSIRLVGEKFQGLNETQRKEKAKAIAQTAYRNYDNPSALSEVEIEILKVGQDLELLNISTFDSGYSFKKEELAP